MFTFFLRGYQYQSLYHESITNKVNEKSTLFEFSYLDRKHIPEWIESIYNEIELLLSLTFTLEIQFKFIYFFFFSPSCILYLLFIFSIHIRLSFACLHRETFFFRFILIIEYVISFYITLENKVHKNSLKCRVNSKNNFLSKIRSKKMFSSIQSFHIYIFFFSKNKKKE